LLRNVSRIYNKEDDSKAIIVTIPVEMN
jgi:hypothetical protein